jgi:hypothetical protein
MVSEMNINSILIALKNGGPGNAFTGNHRGDALAGGQPDQAIEAGGIRVIVRTICWMSGSRRDDGALWPGPKIARWLRSSMGSQSVQSASAIRAATATPLIAIAVCIAG